ncbi:hypothetical protein EVAR_14798_1 [Eumeta japonica]|uniref:Uncharacterized protein n=1 Tax=Eumeta variegata TaxID=151549 RepID=A0A4C1TWH1_EUMVA|nr:hypothetical protein EVAR_14798_1 [Eumeta japonica]
MSYPWGYTVDTRGRKPMLLLSSFGAGAMGMAAAFMPDAISFSVCKLLGALCFRSRFHPRGRTMNSFILSIRRPTAISVMTPIAIPLSNLFLVAFSMSRVLALSHS